MQTKVTDVKFFAVGGNKKVRAFAAVTFNGEITVRGYKIVDGPNGLFVGKPSQLSNKDGKWYDNVNYISEELQNSVHADILERYRSEAARTVTGRADDMNQVDGEDGIPF